MDGISELPECSGKSQPLLNGVEDETQDETVKQNLTKIIPTTSDERTLQLQVGFHKESLFIDKTAVRCSTLAAIQHPLQMINDSIDLKTIGYQHLSDKEIEGQWNALIPELAKGGRFERVSSDCSNGGMHGIPSGMSTWKKWKSFAGLHTFFVSEKVEKKPRTTNLAHRSRCFALPSDSKS